MGIVLSLDIFRNVSKVESALSLTLRVLNSVKFLGNKINHFPD